MNISSVLVMMKPEYQEEVVGNLRKSGLCDVFFQDEGRVIITIEGENVEEELLKLHQIKEIDHIISAEMMFHYNEDELAAALENVSLDGERIPEILEDEEKGAEKIAYQGDLRNITSIKV